MNDIDINPATRLADDTYPKARVLRSDHAEGELTRLIEQQTAKLPSAVFLLGALAAMGASVVLEVRGRTRMSTFVGMWAPTLMIAGVYNKLIKTVGTR